MKILGNTFKEDLNEFLKNYALWICIAIVVLIAITIVVIFVIKNGHKGKEAIAKQNNEWIDALGGKENIAEVHAMGSRLNVSLSDQDKINREALTSLGVSNIMIMSNKVTLIIEDKAEKIASVITKTINN